MPDGSVRGAFDLDARSAINQLQSIRDTGAEADTTLHSLGDRMDELGRRSTVMSTTVAATWGEARRVVQVEGDLIKGKIDEIDVKLDALGRKQVTPTVDLSGVEVALLRLDELDARLDAFGRKSETARVRIASSGGIPSMPGGGGGVAGAGDGGRMFSSLGGVGGALPWWALAAPIAPALLGGATALVGSAGSAALGVGTVGLGAAGPLAVGGGASMLLGRQTFTNIGQLAKAQTAYNNAVQRYGPNSTQARTARSGLNLATSNATPQELAAAQQYGSLRTAYQQASPQILGGLYSGEAQAAYNVRGAMPSLAATAGVATTATGGALADFSKFLTDPQSLSQLRQLAGSFAQDMPLIERGAENLVRAFMNLSTAAAPFFTQALGWADRWTAGVAASTGQTASMHTKMEGYVNSAKDWARLTGAAFRTIRDIFTAGAPTGDSMVVSLTRTLDKWDAWVRANPQKLTDWFSQARTTVDHVATAISALVHDIWQIFQYLQPIFSRATQFISLISGIGPGGLGILGALGYGAYSGIRGATGGALPSAGSLAGSFITGSGGFSRNAGAAGAIVGTAPQALGRAIGTEGSYLLPSAGFQAARTAAGVGTQEQLFAMLAGGAMVSRGAGGAAALAARGITGRGATAFEQAWGGFAPETKFAMPVSQIGDVGLLARGRTMLGAAGAGAARFAIPVLAITSLMQGLQAPGGPANKAYQTLNAAGNMLTLGAAPHAGAAVGGGLAGLGTAAALGLGTAGTLATGGTLALAGMLAHGLISPDAAGPSLHDKGLQGQLATLAQQASGVQTANQANYIYRSVPTRIGLELDPSDRAKLTAAITAITTTAAKNSGIAASNSWASAFQQALARNQDPNKAVNLMLAGMVSQLGKLKPQGQKQFASSTAAWVSQLEQSEPQLRKPLEKLMGGIISDINNLQKTVGTSMKDLQNKVFYYNGQIYTGSAATWSAIGASLTDPMEVSKEKLLGIFGEIQQEAINALTQMGFSKANARSIVTATAAGGKQAANAAVQVKAQQVSPVAGGQTGQFLASQSGPHATGGMIGGTGLLDTVRLPDGSLAAPGEAWIANRHTMNDLTRATLATYGKTAWDIIQNESRKHSDPLGTTGGVVSQQRPPPKQGINPGLQTGGLAQATNIATGAGGVGSFGSGSTAPGAAGSLPQMMREAQSIASHNYPYLWGGGHNMSFSGPYDCSGAVSAVLHAGGALSSPEVAQWFMSYGQPGPGTVTIYASPSHTYMSLAGHGFGTSTTNPGGGANWFNAGPRPGFVQRHIGVTGGAIPVSGGGSMGGPMTQAIHLTAPDSGLRGIPAAFANQGGKIYAQGLQTQINKRLGAMGGGGGFSGTLSGSVENQVDQFMTAAGFSKVAIAGMLGNAMQESAMNPNAPGGGLWQQISNFGGGTGGSLLAQMQRMLPQIQGLKGALNSAGSPGAAAQIFEAGFERAGIPAMGNRIAAANAAFASGYARGGPVRWGGWNARGGEFTFDHPTLIGVGEAGRERVRVSPVHHSAGGRARGGHSIALHFNAPVHFGSSRQDAEELARYAAQRIMDALDQAASGVDDTELTTMGAGSNG